MDAKRKRVGSPRDLALMLVESVKDVGTLDWFVRWCRPKTKQLVEWTLETVQFRGLEHKMALDIATQFFDFVQAQDRFHACHVFVVSWIIKMWRPLVESRLC